MSSARIKTILGLYAQDPCPNKINNKMHIIRLLKDEYKEVNDKELISTKV
tara:strand:+ start:1579 stop:1728 length:150 start_codon:yes stop_codon:yes gene_type:complete